MAFTGQKMAYVNFHHLTEIPLCISKWKHTEIDLKTIEQRLHTKLGQRCTSDKDLYTEIMRMFVDQYKRRGKNVDRMTGIDPKDFHQILCILGLFATEQQALELFNIYDSNGSGNLSVHEFWVAARPQDYRTLPGFDKKQAADEMIMNRARKRMYIKESLLHTSVEPPTPPRSVYSLPMERLLAGINDKIRQNSVVDRTLSVPQTRRFLMRLFEFYDQDRKGTVYDHQLERVLATINYAMPTHYIKTFCDKFPGEEPNKIDYKKLCHAVYPLSSGQNVLTSGYGQESAHDRGVARKVLSERFKRSQVSRPSTVGTTQHRGQTYASGSSTSRTSRPQSLSHKRPQSSQQGNQTARVRTASRTPSRPGSRAGPPSGGRPQTGGRPQSQSQQAPRPPSQGGINRRSRPASRQYAAQAAIVGV